ncbi:Pre-mRNA-splicing factor SYF2 [[Candida] zeylanoides]
MEARLAALRQRQRQSKEQNRKELQRAAHEQKLQSVQARQAARDPEDGSPPRHSGPDTAVGTPRERNLHYTLAECDDWEDKVAASSAAKSRSATHNYSLLAQQVYTKEVSKIDTEGYAPPTPREGLYAVHKPTRARIAAVAKNIEDTSNRRYQQLRSKQQARTTGSSFINEKNRQFNKKLERDYK